MAEGMINKIARESRNLGAKGIFASLTPILTPILLFIVVLSLSKDAFADAVQLPKTGQTATYATGDDGTSK